MKELVARFIREHPENRYNITKNENEYKLSFFKNNALHVLVVRTTYDVLENKYQNLNNQFCPFCCETKNILCRCKHCGYTVCSDCVLNLNFIECAQCRDGMFFLDFERSVFNYDTTMIQLNKEGKELDKKLKRNLKNKDVILDEIQSHFKNEECRYKITNLFLNYIHL